MGEPTPEGGIIALQQGSFVPPIHSQQDENGGDDVNDGGDANAANPPGVASNAKTTAGVTPADNTGMNIANPSTSNRGFTSYAANPSAGESGVVPLQLL
jgi:transcription elongation factor